MFRFYTCTLYYPTYGFDQMHDLWLDEQPGDVAAICKNLNPLLTCSRSWWAAVVICLKIPLMVLKLIPLLYQFLVLASMYQELSSNILERWVKKSCAKGKCIRAPERLPSWDRTNILGLVFLIFYLFLWRLKVQKLVLCWLFLKKLFKIWLIFTAGLLQFCSPLLLHC